MKPVIIKTEAALAAMAAGDLDYPTSAPRRWKGRQGHAALGSSP